MKKGGGVIGERRRRKGATYPLGTYVELKGGHVDKLLTWSLPRELLTW